MSARAIPLAARTVDKRQPALGVDVCLMCQHIVNAQISLQCQAGKGKGLWFDCSQCHVEKYPEEVFDPMQHGTNIINYSCKKCKHFFQKDMSSFEEADEYCPYCDNHFVLDAELPAADADGWS